MRIPDKIVDELIDNEEDEFCPECFCDDLIELPDGDLFCPECNAIIDY